MHSCCSKPTRSWLTRSSSTWSSFRITKARCLGWWRAPKMARDLTRSPRMRSPTHDCTGMTYERHRDSNGPSGRASSAPSGRVMAPAMRSGCELIGRRAWTQLWDLDKNLRNQKRPRKTEKKTQNRHTCADSVCS